LNATGEEGLEYLAAVLKGIGEGVVATDAQGRVEFMNPVAEALTGWQQSEAVGQCLAQVLKLTRKATRTPVDSLAGQVLWQGKAVSLTGGVLLIARDGKEVPVESNATPIRDERGNLSGAVVVFRDISERVQADEMQCQSVANLRASNEDLRAFAHTVAHDLKAPLGPIMCITQVLEESMADMSFEEVHGYLHMIARICCKMQSMIDELLLLAEVQDKKVNVVPLDMTRLVAEAWERLTLMAEEYHPEIILPDGWPVAVGYAPWVEEVWVNYLSNGLKYGGSPPRLELGATEQPDGMVRFWMRDNGPGLTREEQARLYTPFTRLSHLHANGHGLGLSIVRCIVEKLGGQVGVESEIGHGSVFSFTLPAAC
jgi:PAS domain S-box-containing protein